MRTTKPVVAESVTESAESEPQIGSSRSWMTITRPGSALMSCDVAMARLPLGSMRSRILPCGLGGCAFERALIEHLHERAEADRDQEGDDQGGHGAAKCRLRRQQPGIGRLRDRLRQSLDRIGLSARVRNMRTRHALDPRRK